MDDITPLFTPEKLHDLPWDKTPKKKRKKRKKKRDAAVERLRAKQLEINDEAYADSVPELEFENTIEVPEDLLAKVSRKTDARTKDFTNLLMSRMLPSILGLDAAQSFVTTAMRDGLKIEVDMDDSVLEAVKGLVNLDLMYYFVRRSSLPIAFKKKFLGTVVEETAKRAVDAMHSKGKAAETKKQLADLQAMIVRGMSSATRREDKRRRGQEGDPTHEESPYGLLDTPAASDIGAVRRRRSV